VVAAGVDTRILATSNVSFDLYANISVSGIFSEC
jgi:hypothetical protein